MLIKKYEGYEAIKDTKYTNEINRIYNTTLDDYETAVDFLEEVTYAAVLPPIQKKWNRRGFAICFLVSIFISTLTITLYTIFKYKTNEPKSIASTTNTYTSMYTYSNKINITATNEYGEYIGANYEWLVEKHLAEPYKTTVFSINEENNIDDEIVWKWSQEGEADEWGNSIEKVFTNTGKYELLLKGINSNNETIISQTIPVIVKYVKRELRQLTDEDRHNFLHAASKIWKYTTDEGRAKYGEKFTGINELVEEHALASNDIKCDQFHEGSGFFTHHFAITQTFEAALRSIDPSVTLPYWDFTIEGQEITDAGEIPSYFLEITPFLNDNWFGSTDENGHVQDYKFAYAKMPKVTNTSIVEPNSYGYIRSYWNNNNDEYAVRHLFDVCGVEPTNKRIPNCQTHFEIINVTTLSDFQILSPNDGHGTIHVQLGGMGGDCIETYKNFTDTWSDLLDAEMTADEIMSHGYSMEEWAWGTKGARRTMLENMVMGEYFHVYKSLWRSHMCSRDGTPNLLVCPDNCDENSSPDDCKCQVEA